MEGLPDLVLEEVLKRVGRASLTCLAQTSRRMRRACESEEVWKSVVLDLWEGEFAALWQGSWRGTALGRRVKLRVHGEEKRLRHADLSFVERCDVRVVQSGAAEEFDYSTPCIIRGEMDDWKASTWTLDSLVERFGHCRFRTNEVRPHGKDLKMALADYARYARDTEESCPIYLFDPGFVKHAGRKIRKEFDVPEPFQESFFEMVDLPLRPLYRWLVIGPERSGSSFHLDPFGTAAWNALTSGRKRWFFSPTPPCGVVASGEGSYDSPQIVDWLVNHAPHSGRLMEAVQHAGDVVFVPSGWWHAVLNLEETVAVTQNFCNSHNYEHVYPQVVAEHPDLAEALECAKEKSAKKKKKRKK